MIEVSTGSLSAEMEYVQVLTYELLERFFLQKKYTEDDALKTLKGKYDTSLLVTLRRQGSKNTFKELMEHAHDINPDPSQQEWIVEFHSNLYAKGSGIYESFEIARLYYEKDGLSKMKNFEGFTGVDLFLFKEIVPQYVVKNDLIISGHELNDVNMERELDFVRHVVTHLLNFLNDVYIADPALNKRLELWGDLFRDQQEYSDTEFEIKKETIPVTLVTDELWDNFHDGIRIKFLTPDQIADMQLYFDGKDSMVSGRLNERAAQKTKELEARTAAEKDLQKREYVAFDEIRVYEKILTSEAEKDALYEASEGTLGGSFSIDQISAILSSVYSDARAVTKELKSDITKLTQRHIEKLNSNFKVLRLTKLKRNFSGGVLLGFLKPVPHSLQHTQRHRDTLQHVASFQASNRVVLFSPRAMAPLQFIHQIIITQVLIEMGERTIAESLSLVDVSDISLGDLSTEPSEWRVGDTIEKLPVIDLPNVPSTWSVDIRIGKELAFCDYCNAARRKFCCGRCKKRCYCSNECLKRDWKNAHKTQCTA